MPKHDCSASLSSSLALAEVLLLRPRLFNALVARSKPFVFFLQHHIASAASQDALEQRGADVSVRKQLAHPVPQRLRYSRFLFIYAPQCLPLVEAAVDCVVFSDDPDRHLSVRVRDHQARP